MTMSVDPELLAVLAAAPPRPAPAADGHAVPMRYSVPAGLTPSGAVVHLHGGGMISGSLETHDRICRRHVADAGIGLLAEDHRSAPEHPAPAQAEDAYAALVWSAGHAAELLALLVHPMLDERTTVRLVPYAVRTYDDTITAWDAVAGPGPARAADLTGIPHTYLDVGDLDIFCSGIASRAPADRVRVLATLLAP